MRSSGRPILVGLPYDASSSYLRGAAEAPAMIRAALRSPAGNPATELGADVSELEDAGDLSLSSAADTRAEIERAVSHLLVGGFRPLALGGDHSVSYPIVRAMAQHYSHLTILHIDAHSDLYDEFEGDRFSHACPFARIMEEGLARRLVQVGIRTLTDHQRMQAERFGVEIIEMQSWVAGHRPLVDGEVYLSLDLDGLDPGFAPGVAHREPGGLSVREVITLIHGTGGSLVGADLVEYNPRQDLAGVTAGVAAKLVKEIAGQMLIG
jgi:agmatinase